MIRSKAVFTRTISYGINIALNASLLIVSTRFLSPDQVGYFSWGVMFIQPIADMLLSGLGWSVLQRTETKISDVSMLHLCAVVLGVLSAMLCLLIMSVFTPGYVAMGLWFVLPILMASTESLARGLLSRKHKFELIAIINTAGVVATFIVTLTLLNLNYGPYALAIGLSSGALTRMLLSWRAEPIGFLLLRKDRMHEILSYVRFGLATGVAKSLGNVAKLTPGWAIGPGMGQEALGLLSRGQRLGSLPADVFTNILGGMLGPIFSKSKNNKDLFYDQYVNSIRLTLVILLPVVATGIILSNSIISLLLDERWSDLGRLTKIFLLGSLFHSILTISDDAIRAAGKVGYQVKAYILYIAAIAATSAAGLYFKMNLWQICALILLVSIVRSMLFARKAVETICGSRHPSWSLVLKRFSYAEICVLLLSTIMVITGFIYPLKLWITIAAFMIQIGSIPVILRIYRNITIFGPN